MTDVTALLEMLTFLELAHMLHVTAVLGMLTFLEKFPTNAHIDMTVDVTVVFQLNKFLDRSSKDIHGQGCKTKSYITLLEFAHMNRLRASNQQNSKDGNVLFL